jgi:hypothetical protein
MCEGRTAAKLLNDLLDNVGRDLLGGRLSDEFWLNCSPPADRFLR